MPPSEPHFAKSSYSGSGDNCVEIAVRAEEPAIRDSRYPQRGHLTFDRTEWSAFLLAVQAGRL